MGRRNASGGVEIRDSSIRIDFQWQGKRQRETLCVNGAPLLPTPANIKYAQRVAAKVRDKIRIGAFNYADYFPHSKRASKQEAGSASDWLDTWFN